MPLLPGNSHSGNTPFPVAMIEFGHLTHVGLRRELNEDTYYGDSELGLWLVADGMGGHEYGEVASALARETIVREVRDGTPLAQAIRIADEEIIRASRRRNDALPMGTTVVAARITGNRFEVAWVGDSRVYLWREGQLAQLSQDHSYVQELIAQGAISAEQARSHPHRNVVTQALGVSPGGAKRPLSPFVASGNREVLQARVFLEDAVRGNPGVMSERCEEIARRVALDARLGDVIQVELATSTFDGIEYFVKGPVPLKRKIHGVCAVPR